MTDENFIRDFFGIPRLPAPKPDVTRQRWELPGDPKTPVIWVNGIPYHQVFEAIGEDPNEFRIRFSVRLVPLKRMK